MLRTRTALDEPDAEWLHLLLGEWQLLADVSFADLLLWAPLRGAGPPTDFLAIGQMRPTTGPTAFQDDMVGTVVRAGQRPLVDAAYAEGRICREGDPEWLDGVPVREETIPVRRAGRVIAVVARHTNLAAARTPSRLEIAYLQAAGDLAQMVAEGRFPLRSRREGTASEPRVGDGFVRLDADGTVTYASPNALSAYRRLGLVGDLTGLRLGDATAALVQERGPLEEPVAAVVEGRAYREREVAAADAVLQLLAIPLWPGGVRTGALVLVRDVSELRLRDRQLLSKDATIREIHHRVKNNLQTVAALLRLQARRLDVPQARAALEESVRRVSSIALVHETLAHAHDDTESVAFDGIVDQVLAMVTDVTAPGAPVVRRRVGSFGLLPSQVATPLALVLTELLQNAVEHGLADGGVLEVAAENGGDRLRVSVSDDGRGLPAGFALAATTRLGLQIVRTLVAEMGGRIELAGRAPRGTSATVDVPLPVD
ncbi:MAG: sensor histidine kinase [Frankiaceae bacterium]